MTNMKSQKGFSTIELTIATLIGLFVLLAVVSVMVSSKKNFSVNDATVRLQENARFAMTTLAYDLRMSGYAGCVGTDFSTIQPVSGVEGDPDTQVSDTLTVSYADPKLGTFELASLQPVSADEIAVVNADSTSTTQASDVMSSGDTIVIADCGNVELHDVAAVSGNTITLDGTTFDAATSNVFRVMRLMEYEYSIGTDPQTNSPVLYRSENGGAAEPLVEGIEYMRILFGVDSNGDKLVDAYQPLSSVTAGTLVTNVKLGLLARTISNDTTAINDGGQYGTQVDSRTYDILDIDDYDPVDDRVSRKVFTSSMLVRND